MSVNEVDQDNSDMKARPLRQRATAVRLFPTERRLVEQLLAIPVYELGAMTSSDISERSGASRSSIDRLSRKLGYQGLKEMRKALLREEGQREGAIANIQARSRSSGEIAHQVMAAISARLAAMAQILTEGTDLDRLLDWLIGARTIQLVGAGESAATCSAIYMRLVRLGLPINFEEEFHTQITLASLMNASDLAIAVSHSGGTKSTLWAARTAKENGARVIAITGTASSPLAKQADLVVQLPTGPLPGSAEVLDRVVTTGFAEVLFQCLVARSPDLLANSVRIDDIFGEDRL